MKININIKRAEPFNQIQDRTTKYVKDEHVR